MASGTTIAEEKKSHKRDPNELTRQWPELRGWAHHRVTRLHTRAPRTAAGPARMLPVTTEAAMAFPASSTPLTSTNATIPSTVRSSHGPPGAPAVEPPVVGLCLPSADERPRP